LLLEDRNQFAPGGEQCMVETNGLLIRFTRAVKVAEFLVVVAGFLKSPSVMWIDGFQLVERSQRITLPAEVTLRDSLAVQRVDIPWVVGQVLLSCA
jgi:hypothetical protein